jgi:predicted phage terminase large subunit-like protein
LVATYEYGVLTTAKINNWQSSGIDSIYTVKTQLGRMLQANARHPFLVNFSGGRKWIQLKDLKPNMLLVATEVDPLDIKKSLIVLDKIASITPSGEEEVFDVEVDRTENFIANGVVSHNTRWSKRDLTGQILNNAIKRDLEDWEVIELPALLPSGKPLWAEFWKQTELEAIKAELPVAKWEAQYQQNPTSEGGAIIKREMWKIWDREKPPEVDYIIQSWDTAFEKTNRADYSACTTWGVFYREIDGIEQANIIVLDAFKERMEFPELKRTAYDLWKEWNPDTLLVEKKAAGAPLIYELRKAGLPVSEYTPGKGSDKIARVNAVSDLFASGMVWRPDTRWADELVEEVASFPNGDHDDLVDSTTQALLRFRRGGFIHLSSDEEDKMFIPKKAAYY